MYAFLGISLATQDYINPSIDIIKKKGVVSTSAMHLPNYHLTKLTSSKNLPDFCLSVYSSHLSQWMLHCSPWRTLQLSHSLSWIRSFSVFPISVSQQSSSRPPSIPSSCKVRSHTTPLLKISHLLTTCIVLWFRRFLPDCACRNTHRLVDYHAWNGFHLHLSDCDLRFLVWKLCTALESPHSRHFVHCSHLFDEVQ